MYKIIIAILVLFALVELLHQGILFSSIFMTVKTDAVYRSRLHERIGHFLGSGYYILFLSCVYLITILVRMPWTTEDINTLPRVRFSTFIATVVTFAVSLSTIAVPMLQNVLNYLTKYKCRELLDSFADEKKTLVPYGINIILFGIILLLCDSVGLESKYMNCAIIFLTLIIIWVLYQFIEYVEIFVKYVKGGKVLIEYLLQKCDKDSVNFNASIISCISIARKDLTSGNPVETIEVMAKVDDFIATSLNIDANDTGLSFFCGFSQLTQAFCELMKELIVQRCPEEDFEKIEDGFRNAIIQRFKESGRRMDDRCSGAFAQMYRDVISFCCQEGCIPSRSHYIDSLMNWIDPQTFAVVDYGNSN